MLRWLMMDDLGLRFAWRGGYELWSSWYYRYIRRLTYISIMQYQYNDGDLFDGFTSPKYMLHISLGYSEPRWHVLGPRVSI